MAQEKPVAELVPFDMAHKGEDSLPAGLKAVGKLVYWNETPNFQEVTALLDAGQDVKPAQFLGVWHGKRNSSLTIIQVANCHEINPNEEPHISAARDRLGLGPSYSEESVSTRIYRVAVCNTLEEMEVQIEPNGTLKVVAMKAPESLGRAGDPVVILPDDLCYEVIGSEKNESLGVQVGEVYGPNDLPVNLRPVMFQMHTAIFGNPGKGKSYLSGVLIEEARNWQIPTLAIDVNGELIETAQALGGKVITLPNPKEFGLSLNLLTPQELVSVTPNVRNATQYKELIEISHEALKSSSGGSTITFDQIIEKISYFGKLMNITASSITAAQNRIKALKENPIIGTNFPFIEKLKEHGLIVLDCRYLSLGQTQLIAAAASRELQRYGRSMSEQAASGKDENAAEWFSLLFIDEAHSVAPASDEVVSTQVLYELARMGRHVRTGLILSSQSPADLDKSVLKRMQTRFIFALEKDQLLSIGGVVSDLGEKILAQLPKLPRGICAVSGSQESIRHGFLLKVRARRTPVGGSTPSIFKTRVKKKEQN